MINNLKNNLVLELHIPDFKKAFEFYTLFGFEKLSYDPESGGKSDLGYMVLKREDLLGRTLINFYGDKSFSTRALQRFSSRYPSRIRRRDNDCCFRC